MERKLERSHDDVDGDDDDGQELESEYVMDGLVIADDDGDENMEGRCDH